MNAARLNEFLDSQDSGWLSAKAGSDHGLFDFKV